MGLHSMAQRGVSWLFHWHHGMLILVSINSGGFMNQRNDTTVYSCDQAKAICMCSCSHCPKNKKCFVVIKSEALAK